MVSRLPSMRKTDFDAIMESLSNDQRNRIIFLLNELEGSVVDIDHSSLHDTYAPVTIPSSLSPWLIARINGNPAVGDEVVEQFCMTEHASNTLRSCAAELLPQPKVKSARPSLFSQVWQRIVSQKLSA